MRYWVSFSGMKANPVAGGVVPSPESRLLVLARALPGAAGAGDAGVAADGDAGAGQPGSGGDWVEVDRLENLITDGWVQRTVVLPPALAGGRVKLRLVAEDANASSGGVEAAIDDLEITSNLPACYQAAAPGGGGGGGCAMAAGAAASRAPPGFVTVALLGLWAIVRSRRRR